MKKILFLSILAVSALAFTSCENDEIDVKEYGYAKRVFLQPTTNWGCTVTEVVDYMKASQLTGTDLFEMNVMLPNGTSTSKWFVEFEGINPYSAQNHYITYDYCFNESNKDLKAICIYLGGENDLIDINAQLEGDGYSQTGRDLKENYYIYSNGQTRIKVIESSTKHFVLRYQRQADTEELTW